MRYVLLVLLIVAGLLGADLSEVTAKKNRRHHHKPPPSVIQVINNSSPVWDFAIAETVDDFNAIRPSNGPRLVHIRSGHIVCANDITICSGPMDLRWAGMAWTDNHPHGHIAFTDSLPMSQEQMEMAVCHEFMHVLTGIRDAYTLAADGTLTWWYPGTDSCVWNFKADPGSFDVAYLLTTFGGTAKHKKHDQKHDKKHKHRRN